MKKQKRNPVWRLCIPAGIALLAGAVVMLAAWQWGIHTSAQRTETYLRTLRTLMPEPQGALLEVRRDTSMPVLSLEGTDFVGILELPRHGSLLPVCAEWGEVSKYPCRFSGSIYGGSMLIGGISQKGQYNFYRDISVGDDVFFTDMTGNRYAYKVSELRYEKHADRSALGRKDAPLTLFVKNEYAFEYLIVFCDAAN